MITCVSYATLGAFGYKWGKELNAPPPPPLPPPKSPRHRILTYSKAVIVFHLDPPEAEEFDEPEFNTRVVRAETKLEHILAENPKSDLTKYEKSLGIKILSVDRADEPKPDDFMPIGEKY